MSQCSDPPGATTTAIVAQSVRFGRGSAATAPRPEGPLPRTTALGGAVYGWPAAAANGPLSLASSSLLLSWHRRYAHALLLLRRRQRARRLEDARALGA